MKNENLQTSPIIKKPIIAEDNQTIDFPDAMRSVVSGSKVTKLEWDNPEIVVWFDEHLKIKLADGTIHDLIVSDGDMLGEDWVIV